MCFRNRRPRGSAGAFRMGADRQPDGVGSQSRARSQEIETGKIVGFQPVQPEVQARHQGSTELPERGVREMKPFCLFLSKK